MPESVWYLTIAAIVWGSIIALGWKMLIIMGAMTGQSIRASEKERQSFMNMVQQLVEKRDTPSDDAMRAHSRERTLKHQMDAAVDRVAEQAKKKIVGYKAVPEQPPMSEDDALVAGMHR